jgi:hypothetical protein
VISDGLSIAAANKLFASRNYNEALDVYRKLLDLYHEAPLKQTIELNIKLSLHKLSLGSNGVGTIAQPEGTNAEVGRKNLRSNAPEPESREERSQQEERSFGAAFLGPILALYLSSLFAYIKKNRVQKLWLLSREGYFLRQALMVLKNDCGLKNLELEYVYVSRTLLFKLALLDERLWEITLEHSYRGTILSFFQNRYGFNRNEIGAISTSLREGGCDYTQFISLPNDKDKMLGLISKSKESFELSVLQTKSHYLEYLKSIEFNNQDVKHMVDIGYSGTIQKLLSKLTGARSVGHYFFTTAKAANEAGLEFIGHILENVSSESNRNLIDRSLFIEAILTAPHGQVKSIIRNVDGGIKFVYGPETAAQQNFRILQNIFNGAIDYAQETIHNDEIMSVPDLEFYYSRFVNTPALFPESVRGILDLDDTISGFGIVNPIRFFKGA